MPPAPAASQEGVPTPATRLKKTMTPAPSRRRMRAMVTRIRASRRAKSTATAIATAERPTITQPSTDTIGPSPALRPSGRMPAVPDGVNRYGSPRALAGVDQGAAVSGGGRRGGRGSGFGMAGRFDVEWAQGRNNRPEAP